MSAAESSPLRPRIRIRSLRLGPVAPWEGALGLVLVIFAGWLTARAVTDPVTFDVGLAYEGGRETLRSGHPEDLSTWISTPFLAMVMAFVAKTMSVGLAAKLATALNVATVVALVVGVWAHLRPLVSRPAWWITLTLGVLYAPSLSSIWWKQLNLIAFGLAVLGYWLTRRGQPGRAGLAVALSIAVKPLVILLPIVLLVQRRTRRAGLMSLAWGAGLLAVSQAFLAWQANSAAALSPLPLLRAFSERSKPANIWACHPENFAPGSTLCRLAGGDNWAVQRSVILAFVAVLGLALFGALWRRVGGSWAVFGVTCLLSPMASPIAWSHYQLLLAPLFLVLVVEMTRRGAPVGLWAMLVVAYLLAALIWRPYGTLPGAIYHLITGRDQNQTLLNQQFAISQFAQYALAMTALTWFSVDRILGPPTQPVPDR